MNRYHATAWAAPRTTATITSELPLAVFLGKDIPLRKSGLEMKGKTPRVHTTSFHRMGSESGIRVNQRRSADRKHRLPIYPRIYADLLDLLYEPLFRAWAKLFN
jgi:hypothetical protein